MATAQTELPPGEEKLTGQYALTWEQQEILEQADHFAREKLHPLQERMDIEEWWPEGILAECAELGYVGLTAPEKWGGADMNLFDSMLVAQSFAKWNPAFALSWGTHENLCLNNIFHLVFFDIFNLLFLFFFQLFKFVFGRNHCFAFR